MTPQDVKHSLEKRDTTKESLFLKSSPSGMYEIAFENFGKERAKLHTDINDIEFLYPFL